MKRASLRVSAGFLWLFLACLPSGCADSSSPQGNGPREARAGAAPAPDVPGPFPVGIRRSLHVNPDRYHLYGHSFRTYPTTIWYPARAGTGRPNTLDDCMGELPEDVLLVLEDLLGGSFSEIGKMQTAAFLDAELDRSGGPYPVIFFSHGVSSNRFQSWDQCEHLASHGFVVVAPDHYGSALITNLGDRVVFFHPLMILTDVIDRPADVAFFFGELEKLQSDPEHFLNGSLDLERFGILGHSWGGFTCLEAGPRYGFVRAMAALAPIMISPFPTVFRKPFFLLQNDTDDICDASLDSNARSLAALTASEADPKLYVRLLNSGHFTPSNVCDLAFPPAGQTSPGGQGPVRTGCEPGFLDPEQANAIASAYLTAFFKVTLEEDLRYLGFLQENRFPGLMEHRFLSSSDRSSGSSRPGSRTSGTPRAP